MSTTGTAKALATLCGGMGIAHFATPKPFDDLIPPVLPGSPRTWTYASGVAELAVAGLLLNPATRKLGGKAAIALFIGVYPGNLQMAWDWRGKPWPQRLVALGRLPMQFDLIRRAASVARG